MAFLLGIIEMVGPGNVRLQNSEEFLVNLCICGKDDHLFSGMLEEIHNKISTMIAIEPAERSINDKRELPAGSERKPPE